MKEIILGYKTPVALFIASIVTTLMVLIHIMMNLFNSISDNLLYISALILLIPILAMPFIIHQQSKHHGEPIVVINEEGVTQYRRFLFFKRKPVVYPWTDIDNLELKHWVQSKENGDIDRYKLFIYHSDGSHHTIKDYYYTVDIDQYKQVAQEINEYVKYMKN